MSITRRACIHRIALPAITLGLGSRRAGAAEWPARPVKLVVPFSAGSIVDRLGRALAEPLQAALGQAVVVDNQPGAGGTLAVDRVARAEADGYTLVLAGDAAITTNIGTPERAGFDPLRDLAPVSQVAITPNVLVVAPALEVRSVAELIALAKARPGQLSYASSGIGTSQHRAGEQLARLGGVELTHVPYNQAPTMLTDVLAGRVSLVFGNAGTVLAQVREGKLRALGVTSTTRIADAPELPTMAEAGLPGFEAAVAWFGVFAPAATPAPVLARLQREVAAAVAAPALRQPFQGSGVIWVGNGSAEFAQTIRAELERKRRSSG